ncbi:hypothetical protein SADUNF_Sadunf11G0054800 [Salix dunnii]|uniref:Uncharacterized protein n=1 Tax=Salix dunnii TaxID=1413687 RepID=A0A835MQB8_9ROSI|nr:hypothetical protein SADUNF_Sadunf11G0054800 [Salix dunnii]
MNNHINKLDSTFLELLYMFKTAKRAFKKKKDLILLVYSLIMSKKKDKKSRFVSKVNKPTRDIKKDKGKIILHLNKRARVISSIRTSYV